MSGDCRRTARGPWGVGEGEGLLLEGFDERDEALRLDDRVDCGLRRRRVILNRVVIVVRRGPGRTLEMTGAHGQAETGLARAAGQGAADRFHLANELSDGGGRRVRVAQLDCRLTRRVRGDCTRGDRQQPQKRNAAGLQQGACDGAPQTNPLFHTGCGAATQ